MLIISVDVGVGVLTGVVVDGVISSVKQRGHIIHPTLRVVSSIKYMCILFMQSKKQRSGESQSRKVSPIT